MTTRITEGMSSLGSLAGLQSSAARLAALQSQLSSGQKITKPSDNPAGTASALELRGQLKRAQQYTANAQDGQAWLSEVDSTLSSVMSAMQSARSTTLQGLNTGTNDATANAALAQQIDALRQTVLSLANANYQGRPIFGGTTTGTTAFDSTGAYVGDNGTVTRTVGDNTSIPVTSVGTSVFGANGSNVFDLLTTISSDLTSNPANLQTDLASLDTAMKTISSSQALSGANYDRIQAVQTTTSATALQLTTQLSGLQDVDVADMAIQISSANVAYQAALQTTASIRQTSLLDFLK